MARPREFNEIAALEAAIDCFSRRGYEATSVRDLSDRMKISGPSLYNAFGDKHALFLQAVEHFHDQNARSMIKRIERSFSPKQAVRRFIDEVIEYSVNDRKRRGCLVVNSVDRAPHDKEVAAVVASSFAEIEAFFYRSIKAAQAEGAVPSERRAKDLARLLFGVLLGIRVLARVKPERSLLRDVARPALALLD
jgi:TetR/AcrR family transcriptional repressor of nem operon